MTTTLPKRAHDLSGQRRGCWTIVEFDSIQSKTGQMRWIARCDCGKLKSIRAGNWRSNRRTWTCSCQPKKPNYNQLPEGEASFNLLFDSYKWGARRRSLSFELSKVEFRELVKTPCFYCGKPPSQRRKTTSGTPFIYTGIDRVDPHLGYSHTNVVPCCRFCNQSKSDLTVEQWRTELSRLCRAQGLT